ncbi:hypothetical protein SLEP1_g59154 [Rubroshorea leprosula]|uniref:Uncharacterized protein n=1 Tax=Rubroshorea leprosula TaxID=152421 RepID=A0AAV5MSP0_9ROSI|nr:hypothetical protein SLEP1_g59154 [Rubroshorea leprosula]
MLEPACASSFDDPSGSDDPRLFPVDLGRGSLVFSVSCSVRFRSDSLLSPPMNLRQRARGLPDLMPTAVLLLVPRDTTAT